MNENIDLHNIKPFFNRKIISYPDDPDKNNLIDLIQNIITKELPLLPAINFVDSGISPPFFGHTGSTGSTGPSIAPAAPATSAGTTGTTGTAAPNIDNISSKIINSYYNIKVNLRKLEIIKNFILSIIDCNKFDIMQNIKKEKYNLNNNKLFFVFKKTYYDTFKQYNKIKQKKNDLNFRKKPKNFPVFVEKFIENKYGLIKDNYETIPLFLKIFQKEYNNKNKFFYKKLFNEYIDIRNKLINYLNINNNNYGILAFNFIFNIPKQKFITNTNSNSKKNNKDNLNNYIIINNTKSEINFNNNNYNNNYNNDIKVGNYVYFIDKDPKSRTLNKKIVSKINNSKKNDKYTLKNLSNKENNVTYSRENFNYVKKRKEAKKTLDKKINENDLLYKNIFNQEYIKSKHLNNIIKLYSLLYNSSKLLYGNDIGESLPLYNIIKYSLENDFNIFNFIFNYVDPILLNNVIDTNYYIKENISHSIENFDSYYDKYIDWFNEFKYGIDVKEEGKNDTNISDFKSFFNIQLENMMKYYK
jgi:hypothetical protein